MDILPLFIRTALIYVVVFAVMRLMGKREIGKLSLFDLVISVMIAQIAVFALDDIRQPLANALVPIFFLALIQVSTAQLSLKSRTFRKMLGGSPSCLIKHGLPTESFPGVRFEGLPLPLIMDGKVQDENLEKLGKTRFWLKNLIRQKGVRDFKDVFFCSVDHNGRLFLDRNRN